MSEQNLLFTPMEINGMQLKNRLVRSATFEHMATEDGNVTDQLINFYSKLAKGGVGLRFVVESKKLFTVFILLFVFASGCAKKVPCYPPEHYAPDPSAPYTAEEVRIPSFKGYNLAGTLTLPSMGTPPYPIGYDRLCWRPHK